MEESDPIEILGHTSVGITIPPGYRYRVVSVTGARANGDDYSTELLEQSSNGELPVRIYNRRDSPIFIHIEEN